MEHDHYHIHNHSVNLNAAFKTGITINIIFVAVEAILGILSNSMALLSDAGHNLSDVMALIFSWIAVFLSQRKPTLKFTYGFRRSTILIALLNTIFLLIAVAFIIFMNVGRLNKPQVVYANNVIIVATIGIGVNAFTAWLFMKGKKNDLNIRSAYLHFVADALVSTGVVISGIIIALTGIQWVDTIVSFSIVAVILYSSYHLLIDSVNLALDAVPENINIEEVREFLRRLPEVCDIHDLHIWALSTSDAALTVHLSTIEQTGPGFITSIQRQLSEQFNIGHATIQVEFGSTEDCGMNY